MKKKINEGRRLNLTILYIGGVFYVLEHEIPHHHGDVHLVGGTLAWALKFGRCLVEGLNVVQVKCEGVGTDTGRWPYEPPIMGLI